jgi:hypothetical protein
MLQNPPGYIYKGSAFLYWRMTGEYFGYPSCCIDYFISIDPFDQQETSAQIAVEEWKGFRPCAKCAAKILAEGKTIKDLIVNRQHSKPYPEVDRDEFEQWCESNTFLP